MYCTYCTSVLWSRIQRFWSELELLFLPLDPDPETRLNPDPIRIRNTANKEEKGGRGERGKAQTGKREWREGQTRKREGRGIG